MPCLDTLRPASNLADLISGRVPALARVESHRTSGPRQAVMAKDVPYEADHEGSCLLQAKVDQSQE